MVETGSVRWNDQYVTEVLREAFSETEQIYMEEAARRIQEAARMEGTSVHAFLRSSEMDEPLIAALNSLRERARKQADAIVILGIGGSYLGAKVLTDLHCGPYWNSDAQLRSGYPELYFAGYAADTDGLAALERHLARRANGRASYRIWAVIITKSGTTAEPLAAWLYLRSQWIRRGISFHVVTVTDRGNERRIPYTESAEHWYIPAAVGGRFSVCTAAGLVPAAMVGIDIVSFLSGFRDQAQAIWESPQKNAALQAAWTKYRAYLSGISVEVCMPYTLSLSGVSDWYAQLLAESLGKQYDRKGMAVHYGRVPVCAVGTRDMHSVTQEHQEGIRNKLIQFIQVPPDKTIEIPEAPFIWSGHVMEEMNIAALEANERALAQAGRCSCRVMIPDMSMASVGALMAFFCWAIIYEAELADVNAFNQPGVEVYKALMREVAEK